MDYESARKNAIAEFERTYISAALATAEGNVAEAARAAGMDRVYMHRLIRRHGLQGHARCAVGEWVVERTIEGHRVRHSITGEYLRLSGVSTWTSSRAARAAASEAHRVDTGG